MKKKLGVIITLLTLCICLMTPQMHAKAASGKTTIAVSAGSLNIGLFEAKATIPGNN